MNQRHRNGILSQEEGKSLVVLRKSVQNDKEDIGSTDTDYAHYLKLAFESYVKALRLETNEEFNSSIMFRVFGLLFANPTNDEILAILAKEFKSIAFYKYLVVMPQITTHLSNGSDAFSKLIHGIVGKIFTANN